MKYLIWLVGGIAALDQGMKSEIRYFKIGRAHV